MKIFISADMEGVSGVVSGDECNSSKREYPAFCKLMTEDVNAAVEGALEAGATEVLVNDSHGSGRNILPDLLHPEAILSRGQPLPAMIAPLDQSYDAAMLVGYHAMRGAERSVLCHTYTGKYHCVRVNGREFGELGLAAAYAGHFGVPVAFVSGDNTLAGEASEFIPSATAAVVKEATGQSTARCLSPTKARELIRDGARASLSDVKKLKPLVLDPPLTLEVKFERGGYVDQAVLIPGVERVDARTVRSVLDAMPDVSGLLSILGRVTG